VVEFGHAYVDSSVVVRRTLNQPGALRDVQLSYAVASELVVVEILRTLDRMRPAGGVPVTELARLRGVAETALAELNLIPLGPAILKRAGGAFPTPLGSLDSLHLSTALLWFEVTGNPLTFLTHDRQLAAAARACGLAVYPEPV